MNEQSIGKTIRKIRLSQGRTLSEVAVKSELTKSSLSKIEQGKASPPISTLIRIASSLRVPVVDFFYEDRPDPPYVLTPKEKGITTTRDGTAFGYIYEALAIHKKNKYVEPFLLTINPDDPPGTFQHKGQEFIYMLSGMMDFTIGTDVLRLKTGDSLYFDSGLVHQTQIIGKRPVKFICVFVQDIPITKTKVRESQC